MDIQDLLTEDSSIGSLPGIYHQFQSAMADEDTSFDEIGEIILHDPGLSVHLLKIVNSAYYGFPNKIEKISQAIGVIGTRQLGDLLLSTVVIDKFKSIPESVINMDSFWKHSIACGLIAREIAYCKEELDAEKLFVAGMLHDVGQILLCMKLPERTLKILLETQAQARPLQDIEIEEFGFDHAELGGKLLEQWNLSEFHIETTAFHHNPNLATKFPVEVSIIYMADILANTMHLGCSGETVAPPSLDKEAWDRIQLPEQIRLSELKQKIQEAYDETVSLFFQTA